MSRPVRWLATVAAALVTFGGCLWAAQAVTWGWLPSTEETRFAVAIAFATVAATVVAAGLGWWAGRETPPPPAPSERVVTQRATATDEGEVTQIGGGPGLGRVEQHGEASGRGRVKQVGGSESDEQSTGS
ncbi:hypothetical protein [Streptomyces sp. NPDC056144]|uniref:hypothetical protein n=1 Tax=unclassified Streptomyces TaxID=2593676 RepID=UPI0035D792C6